MKENSFMGHKYSPLCDVTVYSSEFPDFLLFFVGGIYTGYRRKSKTLLTIDKRGSKIARHSFSIAICRRLSPIGRQMTIENCL